MSNTDSFIDEVTEEVRRDRLFVLLKRYGWLGGVAVALIVGGTAWREYTNAQSRNAAESLGDALIAATAIDDSAARAQELSQIPTDTVGSALLVRLSEATALVDAGEPEKAIALLEEVASNGDLALIYRHLASFKALTLQVGSLAIEERRLRLDALAQPGAPLALLASEQIALLDIESGDTAAALSRLTAIAADAAVDRDQRERVLQLITALGGDASAL
ncbi:tetratricopeptide repeat protein [Epibacterium ulvae]|uniref:tetratricopeptide repeat protein n=1 Tax=Epibacterium ulvae TaxID=1156985 RepID=UPI002490D2DC|nr:tetratricopeptide repeat protein [Epibacterium ulvae]